MPLSLSFGFYDLPLRHTFTISRYSVNVQRTMIVSISDGEFTGYGEATANPYYNSTQEKLTRSVLKAKPLIGALGECSPEQLWNTLSPLFADDYFALCAIDNAYWDYVSRKNKKPLHRYFSGSDSAPITSFTIGIDNIDKMRSKILETPWPCYKIKLGTDHDIAIVEALRKETAAIFRVDANAAWNAEQAVENSRLLADLNVEFIEQPLAQTDFEGMRKVFAESYLPVIADESCQRYDDVIICDGLFHGINIKLMKCGGITPALQMIARARELGLKVMAGCMTESTVGISSLAQIAPLLDYLDADGAMLLDDDIAKGVWFENGELRWGEGNGSGVKMCV